MHEISLNQYKSTALIAPTSIPYSTPPLSSPSQPYHLPFPLPSQPHVTATDGDRVRSLQIPSRDPVDGTRGRRSHRLINQPEIRYNNCLLSIKVNQPLVSTPNAQ